MGRNSGSQIFWTESNTNDKFTWYCQQHGKWDQEGTFTNLKSHIKDEHGNLRQ